MKKRLIMFVSVLFLMTVLVACGDNVNNDNANLVEEETTNKESVNNNTDEEETEEDLANEVEEEPEELEAEYKINEVWSIVPLDDADEEVVLLTIDDAPDNNALEMAQTLKDLDANAIFFVNGHLFETPEKQDVVKEIHEMGFVIGNHAYSHKNLNDLTEEEQRDEIVGVNDMVEEITGERPKFFRAPFGENTDFSRELVKEEGMVLMNWSYGYDWNQEYTTQETITDIMINTELLGNGANLLMHDRDWTAAGLHDIVVGLRDKGFEMVDPKLIETSNED